jgi:hypothetical protein
MGCVGNYARRNQTEPAPRIGGATGLIRVRDYRSLHGLDLPLGPAADRLGISPAALANGPPPP